MRAEYLRQWLIAVMQDNLPDATNWLKVVAIVQAAFCNRTLAEECMWQTVVLISKGKGYFQGIGLVEILWKSVASLLNRRLTAVIYFQDMLHWFQAGRGTGTSALEAMLTQQLTSMREAVLFEVFLDIQKAYDTLERESELDLLAAYDVRPRTVRLLRKY